MIELTATKPEEDLKVTIPLFNDDNRPTLPFIGLALLELTVDITIGYAAYRIFKALKK